MSETIVAAAIRYREVAISQPRPARHGHIIRWMADLGLDVVQPEDQGFTTSDGRFVDRVEARRIAVDAGQLLPNARSHDELFSEDVW